MILCLRVRNGRVAATIQKVIEQAAQTRRVRRGKVRLFRFLTKKAQVFPK